MTETERYLLTADALRELLTYDPETGEFSWTEMGKVQRRLSRDGKVGCVYKRRNGTDIRFKISIESYRYSGSLLAWMWMTGEWPQTDVDHIDGNALNNKWSNLRIATPRQNKQNHRKYKNNKSGHTGIWWWEARKVYQVHVGRHLIGYFKTKEAAHEAYERVSADVFGEFKRGATQ